MKRIPLGRALAPLLLTCLFASRASAGLVVNFSSSDNFGAPPSDLSAKVTFTEVNSMGGGGTLTIKIEHLSSSYSLADLGFNAASAGTMTVTSVTSNQMSGGPILADTVIRGMGTPLSQQFDGY
jgi:hypothetical protein